VFCVWGSFLHGASDFDFLVYIHFGYLINLYSYKNHVRLSLGTISLTKHLRPHLFAYMQQKRLIDQVHG